MSFAEADQKLWLIEIYKEVDMDGENYFVYLLADSLVDAAAKGRELAIEWGAGEEDLLSVEIADGVFVLECGDEDDGEGEDEKGPDKETESTTTDGETLALIH